MNDRILVTAGTGTIGSHLLKFLHEREVPFTAFVRNPAKANALREKGYEVIEGDFEDPESLKRAMQDVGKVFLNSPAGPMQVSHEMNVVEACRNSGVKHIVKVSSIGAGPDSSLHLGRWHDEIEQAIKDSGLTYTFLQPNGFMQNFFRYADSIRDQGRIYAPLSHGKYSAVDARDVALVAAKVLTNKGYENQVYELTGPSAVGMRDVARAISTAINKEVRYVPISTEDAVENMRSSGMPAWMVEDMTELSRIYANDGASRVSPAIRELTGSRATDLNRFSEDNWRRFT